MRTVFRISATLAARVVANTPAIPPTHTTVPSVITGLIALTLAAAPSTLNAQPGVTTPLAFTHANVVDGVSANVQRNTTVLINKGRIERIGSDITLPAGTEVIDLRGRWIAPGMIDVHTHIASLDAARRALFSGVTTARSASTPNYQDISIRELAKAGEILAPDMFASGVFVTPKLGETVLADPKLGAYINGVTSPEALRDVVRINLDHGVDWIKTRGTERAGLPDTDPRKQVYTESQLKAIVQEAATRNVPVMAHAHGDEGAYAAVAAGVRSIEHGTYMSDSTLQLMKTKGTWFVPTLSTIVDLTTPGGDYDDPVLLLRGLHMTPRLEETIRKAHAMGIRIATGVDTDYEKTSTTRISHEIMRFRQLGFSPVEALAAGTSAAAELLGVGNQTGRIAQGYEADLIVLEGNPLDDPIWLQDVTIVLTNGRVAMNRLPFGIPDNK